MVLMTVKQAVSTSSMSMFKLCLYLSRQNRNDRRRRRRRRPAQAHTHKHTYTEADDRYWWQMRASEPGRTPLCEHWQRSIAAVDDEGEVSSRRTWHFSFSFSFSGCPLTCAISSFTDPSACLQSFTHSLFPSLPVTPFDDRTSSSSSPALPLNR